MNVQASSYPKLSQAFFSLYNNMSDSIDSINAIIDLKIQNLNHLNPEYIAISYFIASDIFMNRKDPYQFLQTNHNIFLTSQPDQELAFQFYKKISVLELLQKVTKSTTIQRDKIIKHLKHLICYVKMFISYMTKKIEVKNEEFFVFEIQELEKENLYEEEEEEYEYEEDDDE